MYKSRGFAAAAACCLAFAGLIAATQLGSLLTEVINWDESTFVLMAQDVLDGHLPYVHQYDNKPPFMFFALAGAMAAFGQSLLTVRLFGDACLLIVSIATFAVARRADGVLASAMAVAVMIAATTFEGMYTQTEHLAMAMAMPALYLLVAHRSRLWAAGLVGLLLSLAVLTRMNLAFLVVAVGFYYLLAPFRPAANVHRLALYAYVGAGLLPVAVLAALYAQQQALYTLYVSIVEVPLSYAVNEAGPVWNLLRHLGDWVLAAVAYPTIFVPLTIFILATPFALRSEFLRLSRNPDFALREERMLVLLFAAAILTSILFGGAAYPHYWNQILPIFAIFSAAVFVVFRSRERVLKGLSALSVISALVLFGPATVEVISKRNDLSAEHYIRAAAELIAEDRRPGDEVWALENHLVLWYLGDAPLSRAAVHPSSIVRESIMQRLVARGYVPPGELARLRDSKPKYLVTRDGRIPYYFKEADADAYLEFLADGYALWRRVGSVVIYRHIIDFERDEFLSADTEKVCRPRGDFSTFALSAG